MCARASSGSSLRIGKTLATPADYSVLIAELPLPTSAARLMNPPCRLEIEIGVKEAREDVALIKFFLLPVSCRMLLTGLYRSMAAWGMTDDTIISFFYRHERAARIYDVPTRYTKMSVARRIIKGYAAVLCGKSRFFKKKGFTTCKPFSGFI